MENETIAMESAGFAAGAEPSPTPQEEWQAILKEFVPRLATHGDSAAERFSFTVILPTVHLSLECRRNPDGDTVLTRDLRTGNVVAYAGDGIQVYLRPDWPGRFRVIRPAHGFCAISVGEASVGFEFGLGLSGNNGLLLDLSGWSRGLLESVPEGLITNHVEPDGTRIFTHYLRAMAKRMVDAERRALE